MNGAAWKLGTMLADRLAYGYKREPASLGEDREQAAMGVLGDRKQEGGRREMPMMLIKVIINIFLG